MKYILVLVLLTACAFVSKIEGQSVSDCLKLGHDAQYCQHIMGVR